MSMSSSLYGNQRTQFSQDVGSTGNGLQCQGQKDSSPKLGDGFFLCSVGHLDCAKILETFLLNFVNILAFRVISSRIHLKHNTD